MLCIKLLVVMMLLGVVSEAIIRKWKFTNNILDPQNWVGGEPSENCKGVIFPLVLGAIGSLSKLYAEEVVLPHIGQIEIKDGGFIEITENAPCLRIKELQHYYWFSPESWESVNNSAVPDVERVPCMEDDVIFPTDDAVSVYNPELPVQIHSLQIGGIDMTQEEWQRYLQSDIGDNQFVTADDYGTSQIKIQPVVCLSPGGCLCHGLDDVLPWVCDKVAVREASCFDPVIPIGHCSAICGAVLHLVVAESFVLGNLMSKVPKYEKVDVHASKVLQGENVFLQVVFVDKGDYNEFSTSAAHDFDKQLIPDYQTLGITSGTLYKSGMRLPDSSSWLIIVLGTLFGTCVLFGVIYIFYVGSLQNYNLISMLPIREVSFKNIRPLWFSRFDNKEEGRMSMAVSFISLDKAFDNPMYDAHRPSTSSEAMDVVALIDSEASTSKTTEEEPSATDAEHVEVADMVEESESGSSQ